MADFDEGLVVTPIEQLPPDHRSGFVAVVGRPNVGKSTLLNKLLGQKIAIVSRKPQTTRNQLLGILTLEQAQVIFIDTPGIHSPLHRFGEYMVQAAVQTIPDADVILWLVDVSQPPTEEDELVAEAIKEQGGRATTLLILNKIDLLSPKQAEPQARAFSSLYAPAASLLISALQGDNCDRLIELTIGYLPRGPRYFPPDQITDQQTRFIAAELVREAVLQVLHQEVPHALAVVVDEFKRRSPTMTYISATIIAERESHKGIIIGKKGQSLKRIGQVARPQIEELVGSKVYLELWVKIRPRWRKKKEELRRLGYWLGE
ncbi:MAG: GTPase Era [Anaerolineae bacterium]